MLDEPGPGCVRLICLILVLIIAWVGFVTSDLWLDRAVDTGQNILVGSK